MALALRHEYNAIYMTLYDGRHCNVKHKTYIIMIKKKIMTHYKQSNGAASITPSLM